MNTKRTRPAPPGPARRWGKVAGLSAALLLAAGTAVPAQPAHVAALLADPPPTPPAAAQGPTVVSLTVRAKAVARPAFQYRLLPDPVEQTPGNAAPVYFLAFLQLKAVAPEVNQITKDETDRLGLPAPEDSSRVSYYLSDVPIEKLPQADAERLLNNYASALDLLDIAARRDRCEWDLPIREQGFQTLLPHLTSTRELANLAALRVRLRVARKDYAGAVRGLQSLYALGRDLAGGDRPTTLIQLLVGAGVQAMAQREVNTLVQQPDAPNLYWPLAALPRPLADARAALESERTILMDAIPQLRRLKTGRFTADDWGDVLGRMSGVMTGADGKSRTAGERLAAAAAATLLYPQAKQGLIDAGVPAPEVDAMPVPVVVGRYQFGLYERWWAEVIKWAMLPFPQAHPGLRRAEAEFQQDRTAALANPFMVILPSVSRAVFAAARVDREAAAAQTVEALRHYATAHDGRLPAKLEDVTDLPVPPDPTTGKPFAYAVTGEQATLTSPAPEGYAAKDGLRVDVTFVK